MGIRKKNIKDPRSNAKIKNNNKHLYDGDHKDSEIMIALVGAVGTDLDKVCDLISKRLKVFSYCPEVIKISSDVIKVIGKDENLSEKDHYERIDTYMSEGNRLRKESKDDSFLALCTSALINAKREKERDKTPKPFLRKAFIINSLKHPEEAKRLRNIYSDGFFLFGIYTNEQDRIKYLTEDLKIVKKKADELIKRDADESEQYGQHTRDTFHLSDFFIHDDGNSNKLKHAIWRILDLIFGNPFITPTFDEFAMFMAFSSALRSADLSRQVGAVITKNQNILSTGANDVPKFGGGLYWPSFDDTAKKIVDQEDGRDYMRGEDSNTIEKNAIIEDILKKVPSKDLATLKEYLEKSKIKDITEYGRVVHAEMEALLACARIGVSTQDAELYCTTFPCHNCAKHIIAAGIKRVVYVEPYPKSKAFDFHSDSIVHGDRKKKKVHFEPFVGVGPRSFFNLFSMNLGSRSEIMRKTSAGKTTDWSENRANVRIPLLPSSYLERERLVAVRVEDIRRRKGND